MTKLTFVSSFHDSYIAIVESRHCIALQCKRSADFAIDLTLSVDLFIGGSVLHVTDSHYTTLYQESTAGKSYIHMLTFFICVFLYI